MIKKKLMRKWIAALRSRRYKQGTGALRKKGPTARSVDRFCCLGVACNIINKDLWVTSELTSDDNYNYRFKEGLDVGMLRQSYLDKIGISRDVQSELIEMNDNRKKFYEIANYLERKYL